MSREPENFLDYIFVLNICLLSSTIAVLSICAGRMLSPWQIYQHVYCMLEYIIAKHKLEPVVRLV